MEKIPFFETRAHLLFVSKGLELFPFLKEYPGLKDRADIAEAKKMFIGIAMISCVDYWQQYTLGQEEKASEFNEFGNTISHIAETISKKNVERNKAIVEEMWDKLCRGINVSNSPKI